VQQPRHAADGLMVCAAALHTVHCCVGTSSNIMVDYQPTQECQEVECSGTPYIVHGHGGVCVVLPSFCHAMAPVVLVMYCQQQLPGSFKSRTSSDAHFWILHCINTCSTLHAAAVARLKANMLVLPASDPALPAHGTSAFTSLSSSSLAQLYKEFTLLITLTHPLNLCCNSRCSALQFVALIAARGYCQPCLS
jgi:hypothetical protein